MAEHPSAPNPPEPIAQPDGDVSTEAVTPTERPERAGAPGAATAQREPAVQREPAANREALPQPGESAHSGAPHEILAVAVFEPLEGLEAQALATVRELSATLERGGYSRDVLYREPEGTYVLVRYWKSDEARRHAPEDPDAQRCWARLAHEIRTIKIYERLEEVER